MINAKTVIVIALICSAPLGFFYWRHCVSTQMPIAQAVAIGDRSWSVTNEEDGVSALGRRTFGLPCMRKGSTLTILVTGDAATADEPVLVAKYEMPVSHRALEGKRAEADRKEAILADLGSRMKKLGRTNRSPIFLAVERGVEQLRSNGCTPQTTCYLFIKTDGQELSEPGVRNALRGPRAKTSLPAPIPNEGIRVVFSGLSETSGDTTEGGAQRNYTRIRTVARIDRVRDVWGALFTRPELVSFEPYCHQAETVQTRKD